MLTKKPEMLQPGAFCEHTMQRNTPPQTQLGSLPCSPDPLAGFSGAASRRGGKGREERGREGEPERKGRGEEVDSDAQLEQGCRLAKAGPDFLSFSVNPHIHQLVLLSFLSNFTSCGAFIGQVLLP